MTITMNLPGHKLRWFVGAILAIIILAVAALWFIPDFGGSVKGNRLLRVKASPSYSTDAFTNHPPQKPFSVADMWDWVEKSFSGDEVRVPPAPLPVLTPSATLFHNPVASGLRAIWLGHASVLLEIDGVRILTDPVLSRRASPFSFMGPLRYHPAPIALHNLPKIHAVVISHDHYDHLDMAVIKHLARQGTRFFVPLGIGAHLERWGVSEKQTVELDWWQSAKVGPVVIYCTPSRHYSGRRGFDYNATLWSSWSLVGPRHKVFYSGDTGYADHFSRIGKKFGPFDLTLIKVGSYGDAWLDIHMDPEHAVQAHIDLKGQRMLPVHWATFNLAYHSWKEPIERTVVAARKNNVILLTPRLGEVVDTKNTLTGSFWWEEH
ncbi:MAG: MBL fold metallo-hydrolase [Acidiferrobacterales bacterium]